MAGAEARKPHEEPRRREDQAAVRLDRFEKERGDLPRRTGRGEQFLDMRQHRAAGRVAPERPVRIGIGHQREARRLGDTSLRRMARHRHRADRAAVIRPGEGEDPRVSRGLGDGARHGLVGVGPGCPSQTRRSLPPGVIDSSFSASRTAGSLAADRMRAAAMFASAAVTASRTAGWPCPRLAAPQVAERSRTLRPSASMRCEPSPPVTASGKKRRALHSRQRPTIAAVERSCHGPRAGGQEAASYVVKRAASAAA